MSCEQLTEVTVLNPDAALASTAFYGCETRITLKGLPGSTAEALALEKGIAFVAIALEADFRLPAGLTIIEDGAFAGIDARTVYIPDGAASIGAGAFQDCMYLIQVRIPASVTVIADDAFSGCNAGLIVIGAPGSRAETYATAKGYVFQAE